jgi:hypothetical protein
VNPEYEHVRSWISSVGAGIAINDLTGSGRSDDICLVDPRTDQVVVSYAPTAPVQDRFTPFALNAAPLPMDDAMAPMDCTPGDFNGDGHPDLLVNYWGRTPILFLTRSDAAKTLSASNYRPQELVPSQSVDGKYHGPRWNTNAATVSDFDGTGHPDIVIANYFPDSDVINPDGQANVQMNSSMSSAKNGGGTHVMRWYGGTSGTKPTATYVEQTGAIPYSASTGWTLAASSADLTGDGKPELYLANDFGKDHLLYNVSTPGKIRFKEVTGSRGPTTAKSFVLGHDSFKGMGVDFADLTGSGRFDMVVSNITTKWGLQESNDAWMNTATSDAAMQARMADGKADFTQEAEDKGLAWTGWGWDVKTGDFLNNGHLDVLQAEGFVRGTIDRWPWLQEMAMTNDSLFTNPTMWPDVEPGDDVAGHQPPAFYAQQADGSFANIVSQLGMASDNYPSRGIAVADTRGNGVLDFAIARQWAAPTFYENLSPSEGRSLELDLYAPRLSTAPEQAASSAPSSSTLPGLPAYGATAQIHTADGKTQIARLDGGGGHSGRSSFQVHFGLGAQTGPVTVDLTWTDTTHTLRHATMRLTPGQHTLMLSGSATEVQH